MADLFDTSDEAAKTNPTKMSEAVGEAFDSGESDDAPNMDELPSEEEVGLADAEEEEVEEEVVDEPAEEEAAEEQPDAEPELDSGEVEIPDKFLTDDGGIDAEKLLKSYKHSERKLSERADADPALVQRLEELEQQNRVLAESMQSQQTGETTQQLEQQIVNGIETNPERAYLQALQGYKDGALTKNHVEAVIDYVYETEDHAAARRMERELRDEMINNTVAPVQQTQEQTTARATVASNMEQAGDLVQESVGVENAEAYAQDIAQIVQGMPQLLGDGSVEAMQNGLKAAYDMAVGRDPSRTANAKKASQKNLKVSQTNEKKNAQVLSASSDSPESKGELSEEEQYRQEVFENHKNPGLDALFGA